MIWIPLQFRHIILNKSWKLKQLKLNIIKTISATSPTDFTFIALSSVEELIRKPPYTQYIIVNNIDSIKLRVTCFATNCTKILLNI